MSAYILGRPEIAYIAEAWRRIDGFVYHDGTTYDAQNIHPTYFGQLLWNTNVAAVQYRYKVVQDALPCRIGDEPFIYRHPDPQVMGAITIYPLLVISLCATYDYQSCELPDYAETLAAALIDELRKCYICRLPGFHEVGSKAPKILQDAL